MGKATVRQAISYAIDRAHLILDIGGPVISPPLTHILPAGINGAQDAPPSYDPYPHNVARTRSMLAAAGYKNGLTLRLLYWSSLSYPAEMFQTLQFSRARGRYRSQRPGRAYRGLLHQVRGGAPSVAKRGVWDLALSSWSPDWFGDAATSFFKPLFSGPASYPPDGSNLGFYYDNPTVTRLITRAAVEGILEGREHVGGHRPGRHEGRAGLPDQPAVPAAVSRQATCTMPCMYRHWGSSIRPMCG